MSSSNSVVKNLHRTFQVAFSKGSASYDYLSRPDSDFLRHRQLSKDLVLKLPFHFTNKSLQRFIPNIPDIQNLSISSSALSQARDKIKYEFYKNQFDTFNFLTHKDDLNLFHGYRLVAIDGSEIRVLPDPSNPELTFGRSKKGGYHHTFRSPECCL